MRSLPCTNLDIAIVLKKYSGYFGAAFNVNKTESGIRLDFAADAYGTYYKDMLNLAVDSICKACLKSAYSRQVFWRRLGDQDDSVLWVVAVPSSREESVAAVFGMVIRADTNSELERVLAEVSEDGWKAQPEVE